MREVGTGRYEASMKMQVVSLLSNVQLPLFANTKVKMKITCLPVYLLEMFSLRAIKYEEMQPKVIWICAIAAGPAKLARYFSLSLYLP